MKKKILFSAFVIMLVPTTFAQKTNSITGYAITAPQKGQSGWKEVRLVDITTGAELQTVYKTNDELQPLNARTGKPVVKKEPTPTTVVFDKQPATVIVDKQPLNNSAVRMEKNEQYRNVKTVIVMRQRIDPYKPFATNSAAMAYDKKHERLYFTPMGINQLRFIDLRSKEQKIYYFEDEAFGNVAGQHDAANQITRMVIAGDGNGYALTNDGNHLIKFTTGKKPVISDLGELTDDVSNGNYSVHNRQGYGGDMIADVSDNLFLVTANHHVFKINIDTKIAVHLGAIKGLPQGYQTNGAMVEEGSKIIVCSAQSTVGYFRFDLNTLESEKVSTSDEVFNASDLANGNLAFAKKGKDKKEEIVKEPTKTVPEEIIVAQKPVEELTAKNNITVYPNPVTDGIVKVSFTDQAAGKYQVQLLDLSGKIITSKDITIGNKIQTEEFRLPELTAKGNYFVRVIGESNKNALVSKIVVQ